MKTSEKIAIIVGLLLFWSLMFLPFPMYFHGHGALDSYSPFIMFLLVTLGSAISHLPESIRHLTSGAGITSSLQYLWALLIVLDFILFWTGMVLAGLQCGWLWTKDRTRSFLWDGLGAISLIGWVNIGFIVTVNPGWPAETPFLLYFTLHGAAMLAYYVLAALWFGHLGSILFKKSS